MTGFLNFHAFAAARGEGLHPKLRLLFERTAVSPVFGLAVGPDGFLQSGPDPASETVPERANVALFPVRQMEEPNPKPETPARPLVALGR
jgi:hypothetical protein